MTYNGKTNWVNNEIVEAVDMNRIEQGITNVDAELGDIQTALDGKVDDSQVLTNVPANAKFTDTITTINGKTGAITKADITALGIPAQDTVYSHPSSHPASMITDLPIVKKAARFVVGTSAAGWTAADCDYLCDGTDDQTEINAAITALPATGGEILILDGTYNITAKIDITKNNVSIRGNGNATILKRMFPSAVAEGVITLTSRSGCKIANLQIDGSKASYANHTNNSSIYLTDSSNNIIIGITCNNSAAYGICLSGSSDSTITGNICYENGSSGICLTGSSNNTIPGNICYGNLSGVCLSSSSNSTITGNTCVRGTGLAADYSGMQHTIQLAGTANNYNLISNNNCMGKAVTIAGGTGNTVVNNKFDET